MTDQSSSLETYPRITSLMMLWKTIRSISADALLIAYLIFLAACCGFFCLLEPETFPQYGNAVWYCFQIITTVGFGDIVPVGFACRTISIVVGISALFIVALVTGVVVSFFNEKMRARRSESFIAFGHQMDHLTELSSDDLAELQAQYKRFMNDRTAARR